MGALIFFAVLILWGWGAWRGFKKAQENGYPEWQAALGAIMLGPFAPLLGAAKPAGQQCPHCRSMIDPKATVCPKCTRAVR